MKITLVTVGKIKERYFEDAIREYAKRLSRYCKLDIIQVADEKTPDGAGEAIERQIKEKEGQRILSNIKDGAYVIALAIEGKMLTSEELAGRIQRLGVDGVGHIVFVIGGSLGLSGDVMKRADFALSFSDVYKRQILEYVLGEFGLEIGGRLPAAFYCNCTKDRVEKALISVGRKDIGEMIEDGKPIEVNCHFCNKNYTFSVDELKDMLEKAK